MKNRSIHPSKLVLLAFVGAVVLGPGLVMAQLPIGPNGFTGELPNSHTGCDPGGLCLAQVPTVQRTHFVLEQPTDPLLGAIYVNGRAAEFVSSGLTGSVWATFSASDNGDLRIFRQTTAGAVEPYITPILPVGSLSRDPMDGVLYGGSYPIRNLAGIMDTGTFGEVLRITPSDGSTQSMGIFEFPSATDLCVPHVSGYISGLAYDAATDSLWLADDMGRTIFNTGIDRTTGVPQLAVTNSSMATSFDLQAAGGHCNSGIAVVGETLWLADVQGCGMDCATGQLVQVDKLGVGIAFIETFMTAANGTTTPYLPYGLTFDDQTYASEGKCVLWTNEATFSTAGPRVAAWEIPCPAGGGGGGGGGGGSGGGDAMTVAIDIKPGSDQNTINMASAGTIPVAILGSATFDVTTIDPETVTLAGGAVRVVGKASRLQCTERDSNGDGFIDMVCQCTNLTEFITVNGESVGVLEALTITGQPIMGSDIVRIVP